MNTSDYVKRYGRDGKLFCRECKGVKLQAIYLAHYSAPTVTIHNRDGSEDVRFHTPLCAKHADQGMKTAGYIGMEPLS